MSDTTLTDPELAPLIFLPPIGRFQFVIQRGAEIPSKPTRCQRRKTGEHVDASLPLSSLTLDQALTRVARERWEGRRCYQPAVCQAEAAIRTLAEMGCTTVAAVTKELLLSAASAWALQGLSPATINSRMKGLHLMGIEVKGCLRRNPKQLKWWLTPDMHQRLREAQSLPDAAPRTEWRAGHRLHLVLLDYAEWTVKTGLRVEETLRTRRQHFSDDFQTLNVPGTKTAASERTIPLHAGATEIAKRRFKGRENDFDAPLFEINYYGLCDAWLRARRLLGITHPGATLKAFRRSAARFLHVDCGMPIDLVRQYLGHENLETTLGYLRLTGGYSLTEIRRYF